MSFRSNRRPSGATLLAVAVGGAIGAPARYVLSDAIGTPRSGFPWATFVANVTGCFVLGLVLTLMLERWEPVRHLRAFVAIGVIGAYTTFSTAVVETALLIRDRQLVISVVYAVSAIVAGVVAVYAGVMVGRVRT